MDTTWKSNLKESKTLEHLKFMRLDNELKEERMATPRIQIGPAIVHIGMGSINQ